MLDRKRGYPQVICRNWATFLFEFGTDDRVSLGRSQGHGQNDNLLNHLKEPVTESNAPRRLGQPKEILAHNHDGNFKA